MADNLPFFGGGMHDRLDPVRQSVEAQTAMLQRADARVLHLTDGLDPVFDGQALEGQALTWRGVAEVPMESALLLLGEDTAGRPCFAELPATRRSVPTPMNRALWPMLAELNAQESGLYATARSLIDWHQRHGFCAACGGVTKPQKGGWARGCAGCEAEHFPRVDPVVIMLAVHEGRILLGRQHRFPAGQYSALAGFLEPGECLEDAVARELWEEAGIRVRNVRYVASQPWPFPSSLMVGCIADCDDPGLTLDESEIEHAFWAERADVVAALNAPDTASFKLPSPIAIAHHLIAAWVQETA
jgi:NAD+ diphosphatase